METTLSGMVKDVSPEQREKAEEGMESRLSGMVKDVSREQ
jgi:hypothetical protein